MTTYDVVVAGLGGFGSSTAAVLARRGVRVLGLDPRPPVHAEGASTGESRIVRQAYFEGAGYVPLLLRAYELWEQLGHDEGHAFLRQTGGLFLGAAGTRVLEGSIRTAQEWDLAHEVLDAAEMRSRFPAMTPPVDAIGLYEPVAGAVSPEDTVSAFLRRAATAGAELRHDEAVTGWSVDGDAVRVRTSRGTVDCGALVLAAGRWSPQLLAGLELPLVTEARVQHWFRPPVPTGFGIGELPVWLWDLGEGTALYGLPSLGTDGSVKVAVHFSGRGPAAGWSPRDLSDATAPLLPGLGSEHLREKPCWYTLTPDENFVVGQHPASDRVVVACGFSGHGFKFTPVLGEVLADLATDGSSSFELSLFDPLRFAGERAS
jgi:sarcosine oxidase